jgi:hypothetical protein
MATKKFGIIRKKLEIIFLLLFWINFSRFKPCRGLHVGHKIIFIRVFQRLRRTNLPFLKDVIAGKQKFNESKLIDIDEKNLR